ncbi:hypothetical protein [Nostoc sp.]|uniref:hypothetical protein n=1 Tax=Nostoc sp. TaxID=1180 RepID=UPI002FFCCD0F
MYNKTKLVHGVLPSQQVETFELASIYTLPQMRSRTTCLRHAPRTWKQATRSVS